MSQGRTSVNESPGSGGIPDTLHRLIHQGRSFSGHERHCVFLNTRTHRFADISSASGLDHIDDGRGIALVDWDLDGDLDLWISNRNAPQARFLRNDFRTDHHFLAVRLEGRTVNRDGIGARVELHLKKEGPGFRVTEKMRSDVGINPGADAQTGKSELPVPIYSNASRAQNAESRPTPPETRNPAPELPHSPLIKTLRAGDGFLAQSSKWIHFGLGSATRIDRLVVHWPGGDIETFADLKVDRRHLLVQDRGRAQIWKPPSRHLSIEPSSLEVPPRTDTAQVFSAVRFPLPRLEYETLDGQDASLEDHRGRTVLLNLWAWWCTPCVAELTEITRRQQLLQDSGLQILALSIDAVTDSAEGGPEKAKQLLSKLRFPFSTGFASAAMLDKLQLVHNRLFSLHRPLPLPTSVLIDAEGRVRAIYKGRVEVDQILGDVGKLDLQGKKLVRTSMPFEGRLHGRPGGVRLSQFAWILMHEGFLDDAIEYVDRHGSNMQSDPDFPHILVALGMLCQERGDSGGAIAHYREALRHQPDDADGHYKLGTTLGQLGNVDEAIGHLRHALQVRPEHADTHTNLGIALSLKGGIEAAIHHFQTALQLDPEQPNAHYQLGRAFESQGRIDEAMHYYQTLLRLRPDHDEGHLHLGILLGEQGQIDRAIPHFREALRHNPDLADAHVNLGAALAARSDFPQAIKHLHAAVKIDPSNAKAHHDLGLALCTQGKIVAGVASFQRAVKIDDDYVDAYHNLGRTLLSMGKVEQAIRQFEAVVKLQPDHLGAYLHLVRVAESQRRWDKAVHYHKQILCLAPHDAARHNNLGVALLAQENFDEAIQRFRAALRINPGYVVARRNLDLALKVKSNSR